MSTTLEKLRDDENGATAVEYALMLAAIVAVIVAVVLSLGTKVSGAFENMNSRFTVP